MQELINFHHVELAVIAPLLTIIGFLLYGWHENATRTKEADHQSRLPLYNKTILMLWALAAICLAGWVCSNRPIEAMGFSWTEAGWRGWIAWGSVGLGLVYLVYSAWILTLSATARQQVRDQLSHAELDFMRPRTSAEHRRFKILSFTAGATEEIVFRGFLIAVFTLFMPLILSAMAAVILFGIGHIYQGLGGVLRTTLVGAVLAAIYLIGGSIWPPILLHVLIDLTAGIQFQLIDRFEAVDDDQRPDLAPDEAPSEVTG